MKKLVLASASPARRQLIRILGLPFQIRPSQAHESSDLSQGVAALVKLNARRKAQAVSSGLKSGLVVGSDTVVYSGKKRLILKPKDLAEAKRNLKELMAKPHWVYSGVAVIDASSGKTLVDYEKTKVFMRPLPDKAIDRYHKIVSPLNKAGGFDIEGKGGVFIYRIEGCYFNVVGLPLAKLAQMLEKFGVDVL